MSDSVLIAAITLIVGLITFVGNGFFDKRTKSAAADLVAAQAQELRIQLQILADQGHKIEVEVPIKAVVR